MPRTDYARVQLSPDRNDAVPERLTEQLENCSCGICEQAISRFEMTAIWPAGDLIVHLACWAQSKGFNREATS